MGFLGKFFGGGLPEWASFFGSRAAYDEFHAEVAAVLQARGLEARCEDGWADIVRDGEKQRCGLQNLAQMCASSERGQWRELIGGHFDRLFRSEEQTAGVDRLAENFEAARPLLKAKLYPKDEPAGVKLVSRPLADDLIEVLTYDLPDSVATVSADHPGRWGRRVEELFEIGRANVRAEGRLTVETLDLDGGPQLHVLTGDSFYSSSQLLVLDDYLPKRYEHGVLVTAPNRHTLVFHPIEGIAVVQAVNAMIQIAHGAFTRGPGSITPSLYWRRDGRLERLPAFAKNGQLSFAPPDSFVELLNRLAAGVS